MSVAVIITIYDNLHLFTQADLETLAAFAEVTHVPSGTKDITATPGLCCAEIRPDTELLFHVVTPTSTQEPTPPELQDELNRAVASTLDSAINRALDAIFAWKRMQPMEPKVGVFDLSLESKVFDTVAEAIAYMKGCYQTKLTEQLGPCHGPV
jgi:hypothetical protein